MPKLTGPDMKTIREGLLLSAQALADRLRHDGLLSAGHVRTVQRWEEGSRQVPDDIADYIQGLDAIVERTAQQLVQAVRQDPPSKVVAMVRYVDDEGCTWRVGSASAPHHHRLHVAALGRARRDLVATGGPELHLVSFLTGRPSTPGAGRSRFVTRPSLAPSGQPLLPR